MKKVVTLLLAILMIFSLTACSTNEPSQSGEPFYDMPDFSIPPAATGEVAKFTLQEMVEKLNNTPSFTFNFADMLANSKQTVYTSEEFKDGEEVKDISPLGLITFALKSGDIAAFGDFKAPDFEFYHSDKMARVKEDKKPKSFMECVVTDLCFDLTEGSVIVRAMYLTNNTNETSTYFCTGKLTYLDNGQYKLMVRAEDYGNRQGKDYVYITHEEFMFTANGKQVVSGVYKCSQDTSLVYTAEINVAGSSDKTQALIQRSEKITVDINIQCDNGVYTVDREMIMRQSNETYDPEKATEIYRVTQHIEPRGNEYVLTERAQGTNSDGKQVDTTQYVTFTDKDS